MGGVWLPAEETGKLFVSSATFVTNDRCGNDDNGDGDEGGVLVETSLLLN